MSKSKESNADYKGGYQIPDWLISPEEFRVSFDLLETVDDARSFITTYLYNLGNSISESQIDIVNELAKNHMKSWLYENAPTGQPTSKKFHPSLTKFRSRNVLVIAMEEVLGQEPFSGNLERLSLEDENYRNIVSDLKERGFISGQDKNDTSVVNI